MARTQTAANVAKKTSARSARVKNAAHGKSKNASPVSAKQEKALRQTPMDRIGLGTGKHVVEESGQDKQTYDRLQLLAEDDQDSSGS